MAIGVEAGDITNAQRLAMLGTREDGNPEAVADRRLMIVHTGWIGVTFGAGSNLERDTAISFVPNVVFNNGTAELQTFNPVNQDRPEVEAIVTASLSSFGNSPDTAAVDRAAVRLRKIDALPGDPIVLVLEARLAAAEGAIHGVSYQVTVLAHPDMLGPTVVVNSNVSPLST